MNDPTARSRTARPLRRLLGASAFSLLALLACGGADAPEEAEEPVSPLDGLEEIRCLAPVGAGADFSFFTWEYDLPEGGYFQVAVYNYNDGAPLGPLRRSPELQEASWAPPPYDAGRFPDEILWRVFAVDGRKVAVARGKAIARRD